MVWLAHCHLNKIEVCNCHYCRHQLTKESAFPVVWGWEDVWQAIFDVFITQKYPFLLERMTYWMIHKMWIFHVWLLQLSFVLRISFRTETRTFLVPWSIAGNQKSVASDLSRFYSVPFYCFKDRLCLDHRLVLRMCVFSAYFEFLCVAAKLIQIIVWLELIHGCFLG